MAPCKEYAGISHSYISTLQTSIKKRKESITETRHEVKRGRLRKTLSLPYDRSERETKEMKHCQRCPLWEKQTPAAADHSKIPEGKLKIADISHVDTVGQ